MLSDEANRQQKTDREAKAEAEKPTEQVAEPTDEVTEPVAEKPKAKRNRAKQPAKA